MGITEGDLLVAIVAIAREVPPPVLEMLCESLERLPPGASPEERAVLAARFTQPGVRTAVARLMDRCGTGPEGLDLGKIAWALRGASAADGFWRRSQSLELVWTGPVPVGTHFRRTDQALLDLIEGTQTEVILVSFVAYKVREIAEALVGAAARGVRLILVLESAEASAGKIDYEAHQGVGRRVVELADLYVWPLDQRPRDGTGDYGLLHAKCAVADGHLALISSANLTEHALNLNMELGVLVRGGELPGQISRHIHNLIAGKVLRLIRD